MAEDIYKFSVKDIKGETISLNQYKNKVLLVVNTASACGFTPQYKGLQKIYEDYQGQGFEVLGFPCNQFGAQEPGSDADIQNFCDLNFKVSFPLFSKVEVNGGGADPLFQYLKDKAPGILGSKAIKWNFTKFLIDRSGVPIKRFAPKDKPEDISKDIEDALG